MDKKIVAAALVFSVSGILAPVAQANPVQEGPMRLTGALEPSIITTCGDSFWALAVEQNSILFLFAEIDDGCI